MANVQFSMVNGQWSMVNTAQAQTIRDRYNSQIGRVERDGIIRDRYTSLWARLRGGSSEQILQRLVDHPEERICASVVIYSRLRREVWLVGDCHCLLNGVYYDNPKPYEQELAEMRAQRVRELLASSVVDTEISGQVGLRNVRQRLELLYGAEGQLTIEQCGPERILARVCFPIED